MLCLSRILCKPYFNLSVPKKYRKGKKNVCFQRCVAEMLIRPEEVTPPSRFQSPRLNTRPKTPKQADQKSYLPTQNG